MTFLMKTSKHYARLEMSCQWRAIGHMGLLNLRRTKCVYNIGTDQALIKS